MENALITLALIAECIVFARKEARASRTTWARLAYKGALSARMKAWAARKSKCGWALKDFWVQGAPPPARPPGKRQAPPPCVGSAAQAQQRRSGPSLRPSWCTPGQGPQKPRWLQGRRWQARPDLA